MKKFYSTAMMLAMIVAALGFVACGDDDEDDVFGGGENGSTPSVGKRLVRMSCESYTDYTIDLYKDEYNVYSLTLSYDDKGRIIRIGGDELCKVIYDELYIFFEGYGFNIQHTLYNGKIVESTLSMKEFGNLEAKNIYEDDYLIERTNINSTSDVIPNYIEYFWNDGNIVKMEKEYYNSNEHGETIIEYSKYKDYNGFIYSLISMSLNIEEAFNYIETVGYLGKCSKNLPLKRISTTYSSNGNVVTRDEYNYEWEIENNLPTKVTINRETYGYMNNLKGISIYTFEWE